MSVDESPGSSIHSCTIPLPAGPSRMIVYGTIFQPRATETRYALTSRPARVPSGKSHSGVSPAIGLYTQCVRWPARCASQRNVALLAERMRPMTVSSPRLRASTSSRLGVIRRPVRRSAPIAVGAHADVAGGIERLVTQRARRAARGDDGIGPCGELPRRRRGQEDPHRIRTLL